MSDIIQVLRKQMKQEPYNTLQQPAESQNRDQKHEQSFVFLFVNSRSGSCLGNSIIQSHIKDMQIVTTSSIITHFFICDLYDEKQKSSVFQQIKTKCMVKNSRTYLVICGGDGTVQWVIQQSLKNNVDFGLVVYSVLPIGTGNDFAKSIGWGTFQFTLQHSKFQELAQELSNGKEGYFDIWQSLIQCFDSGSIVEIKNGQQVQRPSKLLVKSFTNYFGIGTDARVAYIAQKLKANTITLKKVAYGFAGFLSFWMFCGGGLRKKISQILQMKSQNKQEEMTESDINVEAKQKKELTQKIVISKFDSCMTFLNSTSSMQLQKIWETPYKVSSQQKDEDFKKQSVSDGLIQIVSYRNEISLWFERVFHMAKKVGQGNGPFVINFRQPKQGTSHSIYIHINGEPYKITNIKSVIVSQSSNFPLGKIKVVYRNK